MNFCSFFLYIKKIKDMKSWRSFKSATNKLPLNTFFRAETLESGLFWETLGGRLKEALLRLTISRNFYFIFRFLRWVLSFYQFWELEAHIEIWMSWKCLLWDALFLFGLFEPKVSISEARTALMILGNFKFGNIWVISWKCVI